ncbi:MAG: zinc ABC transporter substrate-binding protein [Candidatus Hydrogenedentota bacterium]
MKRRIGISGVIVALVVAACGQSAAPGGGGEAKGKPKVVATIGMIADVAKRIAGEHADVEGLMASGVDPHLYKASEGDVRKLDEAQLVLYNGLNLEGKMGDIFVKMSRRRQVVAVSEEIPQDQLREPPEFAGHYDPHIWFDVSLWEKSLTPIERELSALVPGQAAVFKANAEKLRAELIALDSWVLEQIATIPPEQRVLITAHDAFGYFGRRYGMEVLGLQGISTVSEAGLKDVERVVDTIVSRKIKAIFVESSVPRKSIEAVQAACRAKGHEVAIGGQLYSDAMGEAGTAEGTYIGMVRANVNTIVNALR